MSATSSASEPKPVPLARDSTGSGRATTGDETSEKTEMHSKRDDDRRQQSPADPIDVELNERASDTSTNEVTTVPQKEFKEGGYGWVVVLSVFLLSAHTWGVNSSYSVFLAYYLNHNAFPGSSPIAFAFVGGLSISLSLVVSPLATMSVGRLGTRTTILIGVLFETIAFIGASFTTKMWHLLLSQGVAFGIGMGFIFVGSVGVVSQWFTKRRSFANAVGTAGSGFGGLIYALGTDAMIRNIGLAWAFRILAILCCVVNVVSALLIRDRNKSVGAIHVPFHVSLLRRPEYGLLLAWALFSALAYVIVIFSLTAYAEAVTHVSASNGSLVAALFNLSQGIGRPFIGLASDPLGRINVMGLGTLIASLGTLFIWIFAGQTFAGLIVFSLLGCFGGILWATVAPVAAEVVGIPLLPAALSILWLVLVAPSTCAEAIGLSLRTNSGSNSYLYVQLFTGLCYAAAFLSAWLLRAWKIHQLDDIASEQNGRPRTSFGAYLLTGKWVFQVRRV